MYNIVPQVEEKLMLGGDTLGLAVIDITSTDSYQVENKQREIRLTLFPLEIEMSHHHKRSVSVGLRIKHYVLRSEFQYGKFEKLQ